MRGCECEGFSALGGGGELGLGVRVLWSAKIMPPLWRRFCIITFWEEVFGSITLGAGHGRRFFRGSAASFWGLGTSSFFSFFYRSASSGGFESSHPPSHHHPSHPPPLQPQRTTPPPSPLTPLHPTSKHTHTTTTTLIKPIAATSSNALYTRAIALRLPFLSFPWVLPGFLFLETSKRYGR